MIRDESDEILEISKTEEKYLKSPYGGLFGNANSANTTGNNIFSNQQPATTTATATRPMHPPPIAVPMVTLTAPSNLHRLADQQMPELV